MHRGLFQDGVEYELVSSTDRGPDDAYVEFRSRFDAVRFLTSLLDDVHSRTRLLRELDSGRLPVNGSRTLEHELEILAELLVRGSFLIRAPGSAPRRDDGAAFVARSLPRKTVEEYEPEPLPVETDYITVQLLDEEGEPVAGQAYRLELPDGSVKEGVTDGKGMVEVLKTVSGTCTFTYTKLDKDAWEPA